jgi:hypothetical protein
VTGGSEEPTGTPRELGAGTAAGAGTGSAPTDAAEGPADGPPSAVEATRFAHHSEAEMARILDFYQVRWEYEPTTFPILWNLEGEVVESFAPDFYLPDLEIFLEMTTLKQRLVRKKNRKLRRLRELYPGIRIKLFYARDFRAMMLKYGRLGLAASLSGTPGQVVPVRATPAEAVASELVAPPGDERVPASVSEAEEAAEAGVAAAEDPGMDRPAPADAVAAALAEAAEAAGLPGPPAKPVPAPRAAPRTRTNRRRRTAQASRVGAEREAKG